ncbi:hypothetical protein [Methylophaga sp. OBS1]|uniref:hypothetical protein n=1 Tax=Methylophaga sp. OBS1 TaxID=2991933 RepID=UPI002256455B|nr:hypothetical protein [Methylophaga sp. OBS1]MCX4191399.1 hypothetical protein [Methylophaga sp. OBS1]MCX4191655.1 hypothetical protein [Methylophaga sp. OBS1]
MTPSRLNLAEIRSSLNRTQQRFHQINATLTVKKTPPSDEVIANLLSGYALIDQFIAQGIELFEYGNSHYLLELNHTVLFEHAPVSATEDASQFEATESYFYENQTAGIGQLMEWLNIHDHDSVWKQAAGIFTFMLSQPQLFLEGNHRTGSLIMSYVMMQQGHAPFVLTAENAKFFFEPAEMTKKRSKNNIVDDWLYLPKQTRKFAGLLESEQNRDFVLAL